MWTRRCPDPDATARLGAALGRAARALGGAVTPVVVGLDGDLGAGKTCFAQGVGAALDVAEPVVSPTFTLVCEYAGALPLLHADCYRLRAAELPHVGLEEELEAWPGVALVEWAGRFPELLPADHLTVRIAIEDDARVFAISAVGPRAMAVSEAWRAAADQPDGG